MDCVYTPVKKFNEIGNDTVYYIKNENDPTTHEELGTFIERINAGKPGSYKRITWKFSKKILENNLYHGNNGYNNPNSVNIETFYELFTCNIDIHDISEISEISMANGKINISLDIEKIMKIKQGGRKSIKRKRNIKRRSRIRRSYRRKAFVPLVTSRKMVSGFNKEP